MTISKRRLINTLFLLGFASYGVGTYVSFKRNFSQGIAVSILPFLLILLVHAIDLAYARRVRIMVNRVYWVAMLFIASLVASMWVAYFNRHPGLNPINTTSMCIMFLVPFNAAVVVQLRNRDRDDFDFAALLLKALCLLIGVNLLGYAAGLRNLVHGFEGRINLPFMRGIYDAAHLMSVINLMLLFYLKDFVRRPFVFLGLAALYMVNLAIMVNINSRLSFMVFLVLTVLFVLKFMRVVRGLFTISLFTMPIMMSFAQLIYLVLSQPLFAGILGRVDKEDVTTFNGRTYIWETVADWALHDRTGMLFGNGYRGQYQMRMLEFLAVLWGEEHSYNFHLHSTFLEVLIDQGVFGYVLLCLCTWYAFRYFRQRYQHMDLAAPLFAAVVYLMFIWQIDIFCYGIDIGFPLLFSILSMAAIDPRFITRRPANLKGVLLA